MAQAILTRILEDLRTLQPEELHQVEFEVRSLLAPTSKEQEREIALQVLLDSGLVKVIKRPPMVQQPHNQLVPIEGQPLSETIVEERR